MLANMLRVCRLLVVGLFVLWSAAPADAGLGAEPATTNTVTSSETARSREADPTVGVIAIAAGVAVFVFLAWAAARTSGGSQPANDIPG